MKRPLAILVSLTTLVAAKTACVDESTEPAIDGTRRLVDLSAAEVDDLCAWSLAIEPWRDVAPDDEGTKWIQCDRGRRIGVSGSDCVVAFFDYRQKTNCTATVDDFRRCELAIAQDPCPAPGTLPDTCAPVIIGCYAEDPCESDEDCHEPGTFCKQVPTVDNATVGHCRLVF